MKKMSADEVIRKLGLEPLPEEGGYFRQTFKSELLVEVAGNYKEEKYTRSASTHIYFLVTPESFSTLHRVLHDEVFHFYLGDPVESVSFNSEADFSKIRMGQNLLAGEALFRPIKAGNWQGLKLCEGGSWALLGCTVAPGFEYQDFEMGQRDSLLITFPRLRDAVLEFTVH